jgi:hypothetical protein
MREESFVELAEDRDNVSEWPPMFAREIIYTPYFYLQKRNQVGSINEFSSKTRVSLIDRMTKHKN